MEVSDLSERVAAESRPDITFVQPTEQTPSPPPVQPSSCSTCAGADPGLPRPYVYALGSIQMRFPSLSIEKEFAQVIGRTDTKGLTDRQTMLAVLSKRENRFLARQLCWVMSIEGLDTYILVPRDPADIELLIESVRAIPSPSDIDVIIGQRGPVSSPAICNGLQVPIVVVDQLYSFDREALIKAIPRPDKAPVKEFGAAAEEMFDRIQQLADNAGATDEHRALNYLAVRYPALYALTAEAYGRNSSLQSVYVITSRLSGTRRIVDVVLAFTSRTTDVTEKYFVRVDVTEEFPFLVSKAAPYYDRL